MDEGNFTQQIVDSILLELKKNPHTRPRHVKVKVGEKIRLNVENVARHFKTFAKGTPLEGATLELEVRPTAKCRRCGWSGVAEDSQRPICGACSSGDLDVLEGDEVEIETIDLEP